MSDESSSGLFWPRPSLRVGGQDQAALAAGLLGLTITETVTGLYRCEALFGNWNPAGTAGGFLYFDRRLFDFGKSFEIRFDDKLLFKGRIMALEGRYPQGSPPQIMVLADDRMQDLRMTRRTRNFSQSSDADAFRQIASDHGLRSQIDVSGGATYETLAQINQSDLAFLRERARALDAEVWVDDDTLHVQSRTGRAGSAFEIVLGSRLREFSVIADLAAQRTSVLAHGWDVAAKSALRAQSDEAAIRSELNGDEGGTGILSSALGERVDALAHTAPATGSEAKAHADALFRACARRFVVGRGIAETDTRLRVGGQVNLKGLGPLFSGKYYLSQVRHLFDSTKGIRTEFVGERPGIGRP